MGRGWTGAADKPRGVARVDDRRVLNGIFWVLRSCQIPFADEK
jgi:transposase